MKWFYTQPQIDRYHRSYCISALNDTDEMIWYVMDRLIHFWVNNLKYDRIMTLESTDWWSRKDNMFFCQNMCMFQTNANKGLANTFFYTNAKISNIHFVKIVNKMFWESFFSQYSSFFDIFLHYRMY
jgi:hypothetical protein